MLQVIEGKSCPTTSASLEHTMPFALCKTKPFGTDPFNDQYGMPGACNEPLNAVVVINSNQ
jgi:hypothetical protein